MNDAAGDTGAGRIRLGFVGGGGSSVIGKVHRSAALLSGRFEIVAGCFSSDRERSRQSAAVIGVAADRAYDDFRSMARGEAVRPDGIQAIAILTPNGTHYDVARAFLDTGTHIICEKPVVTRLDHAIDLVERAKNANRIFAVAHAYTGYAMVQEARARVRSGSLGTIRIVQIEYAQGWMSTDVENDGNKIARQRTDPELNGVAGCVAAVGSHAFNLVDFVTGLQTQDVAADLTAFVPGRRVPDNAHMMLRFRGGGRGMMWISQVAPGHSNALRLRVYGERGSLFWEQENPETLIVNELGVPSRTLTRNGSGAVAPHGDLPPGHPEGIIGAFTRFYAAAGETIQASVEGRLPPAESSWVPALADGVNTVRFFCAALKSSEQNGAWTPLGG